MTLASLMKELGRDLELNPSLTPDAKGDYILSFSDDLKLIVRDVNPGIGLYCEVAKCPTNDQATFFQEMMLANLFGQGTQGSVLGLTPDAKALTLSMEIDYNIEYKDFRDLAEDFLNAADFWHSEALKFQEQGGASS